ncbi:MAG: DUF3078 domain-containing protein [Bacteroidales bacterium]|nr:DUF3078 domain-containing protein [Bacteroidales bacterium]
MKRFFAAVALLLALAGSASAQDAAAPAPADTVKPVYWTNTLNTQVGFSQVSLTDWAAGGYGSLSLNTYFDGKANYIKDKIKWENRGQLGYGFLNNFGEGIRKSDDRIIIDSKFGYQAAKHLYFSAVYNFHTQFTDGHVSTNDSEVVSRFMSPAYTSLGLGIDYNPSPKFALNFAPLTGKAVFVSDTLLRQKYGNPVDKFTRWELGAQLKMDASVKVEDFTASTTLTLFSDYLDKPLNVKINWDVSIMAKITKHLSATIRTYLIYDDKIKFLPTLDADGNQVLDANGNKVMHTGVQLKEISTLALTYTFANKK